MTDPNAQEPWNRDAEALLIARVRNWFQAMRDEPLHSETREMGELRISVTQHYHCPSSRQRNAVVNRYPAVGFVTVTVREVGAVAELTKEGTR